MNIKMNKNGLYAFYGSLRREMENYKTFQRHLIFLGTSTIAGFKMFSLGEYPYIIPTRNAYDKIVVDLFKINDRLTEEMIYQMEIEAGYIFEEVEIAKQKFGIYLFSKFHASDEAVTSGDWVLHKAVAGF